MAIKIGIDAHYVGVRHGGNEYVFENILRAMSQEPKEDEELFAFSYKLNAKKVLSNSVVQLLPLNYKSVYVQRAFEIPRLEKKLKLDILHVPFNYLPVGRSRKVIHVHDLAFLHLKNTFTYAERQRMKWLTEFSCSNADHIFTISEFSKRDILQTYRLPESKVTVTPLATASKEFRPLNEFAIKEFLNRFGINYPFFLFVGTLQPRKNTLALMRSFNKFIKAHPSEIKLILIGRKGWLYESIFDFIQDNQLSERVVFYENVSAADLTGFYNAAEAFVFPSIFEGFGLPILEAMSCGCPVISSNASSMPEVYGDAALSFHPHDESALENHLLTIIKDQSLRSQLIERGYKNVARFSWSKTVDIIRKVYNSL